MTAFWILGGLVLVLGVAVAILQDAVTNYMTERLDRINPPAEKAAAVNPRKDRDQEEY